MSSYSFADVSVIIPTFYSSATLDRALQSVLAQTIPVREIIVIDDSEDPEEGKRVAAVIAQTNLNGRIHIYYNEYNMGPSYSRNLGIRYAKGQFVAFLDSDDVWHPFKIEIQYALMQESGAWLSGHKFQHIIKDQLTASLTGRFRVVYGMEMLVRNPFATPTVMALRKAFKPFPEDLRHGEDYFCWISNFKPGRVLFISDVLAGGYKASYGISGLSADVDQMSRGVRQVFKLLYKSERLSVAELAVALGIEKLKLLRRRAKVHLRKWKSAP